LNTFPNLKIIRLSVNTKINWRLLINAAKNNINEEEQAALNVWINISPDLHQKILDDIVQMYRQKNRKKKLPDAIFNRFVSQYQVNLDPADQERTFSRSFNPFRFISMPAAAAAIALVLVCSGIFFFLNKNRIAEQTGFAQKPDALVWKEIKSATGKQVFLTLSDGSTIRLSPGSSLKYPVTFAGKERRVHLEGEAFFEITKNPEKPFMVEATHLTTRVLGTSFQVVAFKDQALTSVTVVTGKVSVSRNRSGHQPELMASLSPDQRVLLNWEEDSMKVTTISPAQTAAIKEGKLVFDNNSLKEVAEKLQTQYGIAVHLANDEVAARRITATFDQNISMSDLSEILGQVSKLKVRHDNNDLYIGQ
jgi:transmembrane sensor